MYSFRNHSAPALLIFLLFLSVSSIATTITVTSSNDSATGSLRDAIATAGNGDTITFDASLLGDTIKLTSGEIAIGLNLTILGLGDDSTIISGSNNSRIFTVNAGDTVSIEHLTLTNGMVADSGGAIYNSGMLTLKICTISNCSASSGGGLSNNSSATIAGCIFTGNTASTDFGGGIYSSAGTFSITNSNFQSNTAFSGGGAIASRNACSIISSEIYGNSANSGGGIYQFQGTLIINNIIIASNSASLGNGGGIYNAGNNAKISSCLIENNHVNNSAFGGAGIFSNNNLSIVTSTIRGNTSSGNSGGILNAGIFSATSSSIYNNSATGAGGGIGNEGEVFASNSTISNNMAGSNGGGVSNTRKATLDRCTVAENHADSSGGGISNSDSLIFSNTLVAQNSTGGQGQELFNISGSFVSLGYNLVQDISPLTSSNILPASGDQLGTNANAIDPLLGPLQNNGGATQTHLLKCGSPAIDTGNPANAPSTDQRGLPRIHGIAIDIGPVESQADPVVVDAVITNATTNVSADGAIQVLISGGTSPYFALWSTGDSSYAIANLTCGNYSVTVEDFFGCTATDIFTVDCPDGTFETAVPNVTLTAFPNPAHHTIYVSIIASSFPTGAIIVEVFNYQGVSIKTIETAGLENTLLEIPVVDFPAGNYFVLISSNDRKTIGKCLFKVAH